MGMQTMSQGNNGLDMNLMMPMLMMDNDSDGDNLLNMVMINSMMGGMDTADGFANNFNMLLPMLMMDSDDDDSDTDLDMLVLLTAMQSQAPGSAMGASSMMPLLMMDSGSNNQELLMFMSMMGSQQC